MSSRRPLALFDELARTGSSAALRDLCATLQLLFADARDAILIADAKTGVILEANAAAVRLFGRSKRDLVGMHQSKMHEPAQAEYYRKLFRKHVRMGSHGTVDGEIVRADGEVVPVEINTNTLRLRDGRVLIQGFFHDLRERKRAERMRLRREAAYGSQLKAMSQRLMELQEAERRHLARELHDEIGQLLTGLKMAVVRSRKGGSAKDESLRDTDELLATLIDRVRSLSLDLRPSILDNLGLTPTLQWHCDRYARQTGIAVTFRHAGVRERRFGSPVETAVFRIVQEALTNVARHAGTRRATVRLSAKARELEIQVSDRGIGFNPRDRRRKRQASGLLGMRERAELLGGTLQIESRPGRGTTIVARLPCSDEDTDASADPARVANAPERFPTRTKRARAR